MCIRDRYKDFADFQRNMDGEEYNYILRKDGNWYVEFYGEFNGLLNEAFAFQAQQEEME